MTQKVLEIDVMVYNMTKNPKIYKKIFLWWNWKSANLENSQYGEAQKYKKGRVIKFFCEISEN